MKGIRHQVPKLQELKIIFLWQVFNFYKFLDMVLGNLKI